MTTTPGDMIKASLTQKKKRKRKKSFSRGGKASMGLGRTSLNAELEMRHVCTIHTCFHALPWYNCHANAATFLCLVWIVKFPFPCSFPGRKPKRRCGNPGSPLSGPNLLVLEYILNILCKYYPRVWDRKLVNEASRQGSRVSPWP